MSGGYRPFDGDAWLGRDIPLAGGPYRIAPETAFAVAEEMAFARQGRKARVYKLLGPDGAPYALKTFYRAFSLPEYGPIIEALHAFGDIDGLRACRRRLVGADEAASIGEPGLAYAVLMPWIEGVSWAGVVEARFPLDAQTCLALAAQTARTLAQMEDRGLVHADISSSNVVITHADSGPAVELIDVEDMYHDSLGPLPYVPDGSPGYAHPRNAGRGCRNKYGDRFAGAIILTEMLTWADPEIRRSTADVSVFAEPELCRSGGKYDLVHRNLRDQSPIVSRLFERVWDSPGPANCPRLAEWAAAIATLSPHTTVGVGEFAVCPGCRRPVALGDPSLEHAPQCPLRPAAAPAPVPAQSAFPGVPTHEQISFIPLFDTDGS